MATKTVAGRSAGKREPARLSRVTAQGAAPLREEIATLAHELESLLVSVIASNTADQAPAAAVLCRHIGWIADRAAGAFGGYRVRGDADAWLLSPRAAGTLARIETAGAVGSAA